VPACELTGSLADFISGIVASPFRCFHAFSKFCLLKGRSEVPRLLTILTGRNLPKLWQPREPEPSIINEKTIADFTRVVEQTEILQREQPAGEAPSPKE
jgi:hypothetical protein